MAFTSSAYLPPPDVYEQEYTYWPWRHLLAQVRDYVVANAPQGGTILDYMSGTGLLLRNIRTHRPDLVPLGCDIHRPYVEFARAHHLGAKIFHADAREFT